MERGTVLLTLGRLPVALELARSLHRLGWRTVVADPLGLHLCRFSNAVDRCARVRAPAGDPDGFLDDLVDLCERESVGLVVPVSEEVPHVARLRVREGWRVPVLCPEPDAVLGLHDKHRFASWLAASGLPAPASARADEPGAAALAARVDHVIKPRLSASGAGVSFGRAGDPLPTRAATHLVQERLGPDALCTCTLASRGVPLATVAYRGTLLSGSVAVRFESVAVPDEVGATIDACARAHAVDGALSFDFMADDDGRWRAIECNPRATSGLHLMGSDLLDRTLGRCVDGALGRIVPGPGAGANGTCVELEPGRRRQELWTSLTELQGRALRGRIDRDDWRAFARTPDVTWSRADPRPCLGMTLASAPLLWRAVRRRRPITEVTVDDVGWYADAVEATRAAAGKGGA